MWALHQKQRLAAGPAIRRSWGKPFSKDSSAAVLKQNRLSQTLLENYEKQQSPSSCSVASAAIMVNTIQAMKNQNNPKRITQSQILERVRSVHWKERLSSKGYKGRRGLPFDVFGRAIAACLKDYEIPFKNFAAVAVDQTQGNHEAKKGLLRSRLLKMAQQQNCVIIAHFNQGFYFSTWQIPHISPVGGYDPAKDRVLVLDVDYEVEQPYFISTDTFFKGMSGIYPKMLRRYGYAAGGYVWVEF